MIYRYTHVMKRSGRRHMESRRSALVSHPEQPVRQKQAAGQWGDGLREGQCFAAGDA